MVVGEIPADLADKAAEFRANMIEAAVEMDDTALEAFLEGKEPDEATLRTLIRKATITRAFYPMMCGSAFKNKGVQPLLDAVVDYLPSPLDRPAIKGIDPKDDSEVTRKSSDSEPAAFITYRSFCRARSRSERKGVTTASVIIPTRRIDWSVRTPARLKKPSSR